MGTRTLKVGLCIVALCLGLIAAGWTSPPTAELAPPTVAVHNAAGTAGEGLVGVVAEVLATRAQAMPQMRASVGQPWALEAEIVSASISESRAQVRLVAELTPPAGNLQYLAEAECEGKSGAEAAGKACDQAMEDLGVVVNAKGTVYHYGDKELEAWITIGSDQGIRPGARVAFLSKGQKVGQGLVVTAKDGDSIVRVDKNVPAGNVVRGVDARVVQNGPRSAVQAVVAHKRRERAAGAFLSAAVLWALIASAR